MKATFRLWLPGLILSLLLVLPTSSFGEVKAKPRKAFVSGEIILYMQPGTPMADVRATAAQVGANTVIPLLLADCYKVVLPAPRKTDPETLMAVARLKQNPRVRWVGTNRIFHKYVTPPTSEPNDPHYTSGEQWGLKMINMPQAWFLQKGAPGVNVGMIDDSFDLRHEDLSGQADPGSFNFADNNTQLNPTQPGVEMQHGTFVGGIMVAKTNNQLGIAGIDWQNIKIVACKVTSDSDPQGNLNSDAIINALDYVATNKDKLHIVACNMSFGGPGDPTDTSDPFYVATKLAADAGVLMVAAAGNDATTNNMDTPAAYPFVITVSALGPSGKLATYSSFGKVDIAAPGGDIDATGLDTDGIISTVDETYEFAQGTSFAAPHVTAVLGLLMSTPGLTPDAAKQAMLDMANHTGLGTLPDPKFGYGILDAYAALLKISISAKILSPQGVDANGLPTDPSGTVRPVQTLKPTLRFQLANINPATVQVKIDGQVVLSGSTDVQNSIDPDIPSTVPSLYTIKIRRPLTIGTHTVAISGSDLSGVRTVTDTRTFDVTPFVLQTGLSFFSMPYYQGPPDDAFVDPDQLLGSGYTLYRWVQSQGRYVVYPSNDPDKQLASLNPPDITAAPDNMNPTPPLGLARFVLTTQPQTILTNGENFPTRNFNIPLVRGWNMVGDPYDFPISFNSAKVQLPTGTQLSLDNASNIILPIVYQLVGGQYQFKSLGNSSLDPWQGQWIYVFPNSPYDNVTLVLTPTEAVTSNTTTSSAVARKTTNGPTLARVAGSLSASHSDCMPQLTDRGSWAVRLVARTRNLKDVNNFVGVTARATEGFDETKVPKPPQVAPYVSLGILRSDPQASVFSQDLRPPGGVKTWDLNVATDQAHAAIVLSWPNIKSVPRSYRLLLTDKVTGKTVDLRRQSSYKYNSGPNAVPRNFILRAVPVTSDRHPLLSRISIAPTGAGREAATYEIAYALSQEARVDVSILGANGQPVARVAPTRDVANGANRVVWNGRNVSGQPVPAGLYSVQLRAHTQDGEITREIRPFLNAGR